MKKLGLAVLLCMVQSSQAFFDQYKAVRAYEKKDFSGAQSILKQELVHNSGDAQLLFDLGDTAYRLKEFDQAQAYFSKAHAKTTDPVLQQKALFNLGNTFVQKQKLQEALDQYKKVLAINPHNQDALHNKKVVEELLKQQEEQKKKEEEKKQQQQNKKDQQKQDESEEQEKGGQDQGDQQKNEPQESDKQEEEQKQQQQGQGNQQKGNGNGKGNAKQQGNEQGEGNESDNNGDQQENSSSQKDSKGSEQSNNNKNDSTQNDAKKSLEDKIREQEGKQGGQKRKDQSQNQQLPDSGPQEGKGKPENAGDKDQGKEKRDDKQVLHGDSKNKEKGSNQDTKQESLGQEQQGLYAEPADKEDEEKDEVARIIDKIDGESGKQLFRYMVKSKMEPQYGQKNW